MTIVWDAIRYFTRRGLCAGTGLGALYALVLFQLHPIGMLYGAFFGGIVGLPAGVVCGLLVGRVTDHFFNPLTDSMRYRWTLTVICPVFAFVASAVGFLLLFQRPYLYVTDIPPVIAAGAAVYVARGYAAHIDTLKKSKPEKVYA